MFGTDSRGNPHTGFIGRSNADFKTIPTGPVVLSLRVSQLPASAIIVKIGGDQVEDAEVIETIADRIEYRYFGLAKGSTGRLGPANIASGDGSDDENTNVLETYARNVITEVYNNQVIEIVDRPYFEDICIAPCVRTLDDPSAFTTVHEMSSLVDASRSVIMGEPGSGKTHALRKLELDLVRQYPMLVIPIYISLSSFAGRAQRDSLYTFEQHVNDELRIVGCESIDVLLQIRDRLILLLLDGWDEMWSEEPRREVKRYLARVQHHCIVATRPEDLRTLPFRDRYVMEPLSTGRMREFLRLRIEQEDRVDELMDWIRANSSILKLAENPLNLSIIGIVFKEEGSVPNLTKTKLHARAFDVIFGQHYKANPYEGFMVNGADVTSKIVLLLQWLAYETVMNKEGRFFTSEQLHKVAQRVLGFVPTNLSRDLAGRLGIIRDRCHGRFEFFHPWYQEFLAAKHVKESSDTVYEMIETLDKSQFASCLPYVVGLLSAEEAVQLMTKVTIHDASNYCRAISEGGFSDAAMRKLLLAVTEWAENCSPRIPVRLGLSRALAETGPSALGALYSIARDASKSDYMRRSALEAIARLETEPTKFGRLLLELLPSSSNGLLWHTTEHIGNRRLSEAKELLLTHSASSDPITAGDSMWALRQLGVRAKDEISDLADGLCRCLVCDDDHIQGHALRTIGRLKIQEAIPTLWDYLRHENAKYRWIVPEAASLIGGKDAMNLLDEALLDKDSSVVASAIRGIGEIQDVVPQDTVEKVRHHVNSSRPVKFLDQTLGSVARTILAKLKRKGMPGKLARFYVVRHCKTEWNLQGRLQGKRDLPLCAEGVTEARRNVRVIENLGINRIYCSNTRRAQETADIYARHLEVPVHTSPRLREINHGVWEEHYFEELQADESLGYADWMQDPAAFKIPGSAESITSAQQRICEQIRDIAQSFRDETVLIVSHKHIMAALMCAVQKNPLTDFSSLINESVKPCLLPPNAVADICRKEIAGPTASESI
jgi:probable phosphoglycerate mutase